MIIYMQLYKNIINLIKLYKIKIDILLLLNIYVQF